DAAPPDIFPKRHVEVAPELVIAVRVISVKVHHSFKIADAIKCHCQAAGILGQIGKQALVGDPHDERLAEAERVCPAAVAIEKSNIGHPILPSEKPSW